MENFLKQKQDLFPILKIKPEISINLKNAFARLIESESEFTFPAEERMKIREQAEGYKDELIYQLQTYIIKELDNDTALNSR